MRARIKLGIKNMDEMIGGGIPEGNQVAVAGGPGSGKTLLGFEYLYHSAKAGNNGVLFSLEEASDMVIENAKSAFTDFTDIDELVANKKLVIYGSEEGSAYVTKDPDKGTYSFGEWISNLESVASQYHASRIVIDSVSVVKLLIRDPFEYRDTTMNLVRVLRRLNATTLITVELETAEKEKLTFQPEFFMYDGIIALYLSGEGSNRVQTMEIIKMRGSGHSFSTVPYEITPSGISVLELPHGEDIHDI